MLRSHHQQPEVDLKLLTEQRNMFYFYYQQLCHTLEIENTINDKIFNQFDIFDSTITESCNDFKNYQPTATKNNNNNNNSIANFLTFLTEIETWIRTLKRKNRMISDEFEEEHSEKVIALPGYEPVVTSNFQNLLLRFSKILMLIAVEMTSRIFAVFPKIDKVVFCLQRDHPPAWK